jgi:cobalt-zinc-cadmium resistance protein CzcA
VLDWALERKKVVIGAAVALLLGSLALFPFLGKEFMPTLQEDAIMFRVVGIPSTSLDESIRVANVMDASCARSIRRCGRCWPPSAAPKRAKPPT